MFKWLRRKNANNTGKVEYEEISEKKTTKVGYFFLILMIIFLVSAGQMVFMDLKRIPDRPANISDCANRLASILDVKTQRSSYYYDGYYGNRNKLTSGCTFSAHEREVSINDSYRAVESYVNEYYNLGSNLKNFEDQLSRAQRDRNKNVQNYDVSLQERQANVESLYEDSAMRQQLSSSDMQISSLTSQISSLKSQRSALVSKIRTAIPTYESQYKKALELREKAYTWYKFKIFLLKVLFVAPFFGVSLYLYFRLKRKDSQYTIIAGGVLGASGILLLQVIFILLYEIIPPEVIDAIVALFTQSALLRYVLYYGSIILVVALFGGVVYYIQKKVFNPQAVAIRHLKDHKCPKCSFVLDQGVNYCPRCAYQVREKCPHCDQDRYREMPCCQWCGSKRGADQADQNTENA
jgi:hypothetical protein